VQKPSSRREADQKDPPEFYTVRQLADLLQLTEMTIYRKVKRAELPCHSIGRVKRFRRRDIEKFLDGCRVPSVKQKRPSS
jgi:excisionase family DNA binding protein